VTTPDRDRLAALLHERFVGCVWSDAEQAYVDDVGSHRVDAELLLDAGVRLPAEPGAPTLTEPILTKAIGTVARVVGGELLAGGVKHWVGLSSAILAELPVASQPLPASVPVCPECHAKLDCNACGYNPDTEARFVSPASRPEAVPAHASWCPRRTAVNAPCGCEALPVAGQDEPDGEDPR
jgi:hypothetical protein